MLKLGTFPLGNHPENPKAGLKLIMIKTVHHVYVLLHVQSHPSVKPNVVGHVSVDDKEGYRICMSWTERYSQVMKYMIG